MSPLGLPMSRSRCGRAVASTLAGLLIFALLLCWTHGVGGSDDTHALLHAPCAPLAVLVMAVALVPLLSGAGWLLLPGSPALVAVSLRAQDPPPKRFPRA